MKKKKMITEEQNLATLKIDKKPAIEILKIINKSDKKVAYCVEKELSRIAEAVKLTIRALKKGGRLFYIGSGTSGRLGIIDAAECPPTFGTDPELVQGTIAGGKGTVFRAREGCEDKEVMGGRDLMRKGLNARDVVVGLSTSGRTPYVYGALKKAKAIGAKTVAIICNPEGPVSEYADVAITPITGPEVIMGSTRMKAGTAEKMILNMISTTAMIKLGRVTGNLMTDMQVTCTKLEERAKRIIVLTTGVDEETAKKLLAENKGDLKRALKKAQRIFDRANKRGKAVSC